MTMATLLLSDTDCRYCEACWTNRVETARTGGDGERDLLCFGCARENFPRRVDLFPPFGIYGLASRKVRLGDGRHGKPGGPQLPPDPGPHPPPHPRPQSPPGTPPV
ncbi:hypothetical protein ACIOJD_21280 [Streptomyces sp. NPDC088116]|uniref:hypothetical protein n=1 Tax=Streptomyces sp. NPDC088116 TaxID=3365825 RepID=UPI0037F94BE6